MNKVVQYLLLIRIKYYYDAFGCVLEAREDVQNRITCTGQQFDGITGQYYLRARFYNPIIGRFAQEDVYRGDGLNLYAYCGNNPVMYYDSSGYKSSSKERPFSSQNENPFVMDLQLFGKKKASCTDFVFSPNGITESVSNGQYVLDRYVGKSDSDLINRANDPNFIEVVLHQRLMTILQQMMLLVESGSRNKCG